MIEKFKSFIRWIKGLKKENTTITIQVIAVNSKIHLTVHRDKND